MRIVCAEVVDGLGTPHAKCRSREGRDEEVEREADESVCDVVLDLVGGEAIVPCRLGGRGDDFVEGERGAEGRDRGYGLEEGVKEVGEAFAWVLWGWCWLAWGGC